MKVKSDSAWPKGETDFSRPKPLAQFTAGDEVLRSMNCFMETVVKHTDVLVNAIPRVHVTRRRSVERSLGRYHCVMILQQQHHKAVVDIRLRSWWISMNIRRGV